MTDFRALCAELVDLLDCFGSTFNIPIETSVVARARAALAKQPVGLTDEELWEAWGCFEHEPFSKEDTIMQLREFLVRWGQS
jgi:hypothetical protein